MMHRMKTVCKGLKSTWTNDGTKKPASVESRQDQARGNVNKGSADGRWPGKKEEKKDKTCMIHQVKRMCEGLASTWKNNAVKLGGDRELRGKGEKKAMKMIVECV